MCPNILGLWGTLSCRYNPLVPQLHTKAGAWSAAGSYLLKSSVNNTKSQMAKAGSQRIHPKLVTGVKAHHHFTSGFYIPGLEIPKLVLPYCLLLGGELGEIRSFIQGQATLKIKGLSRKQSHTLEYKVTWDSISGSSSRNKAHVIWQLFVSN